MFQNYLLTAYRTFLRHGLYSFINVASLAIALVAGLYLYLYVDYETSFDTHWVDAERIYRPHTVYQAPDAPSLYDAWVPFLLEGMLERNFPDLIESAGSGVPGFEIVRRDGEVFYQHDLVARKDLFDTLHFESVDGGALPPFRDPDSLYISEKTAPKYFGDRDPVGQIIEMDIGDGRGFISFIVRGVFKDLPPNSHMQVEMIREYSDALLGARHESWQAYSMMTYIKLKEGASIEDFAARMDAVKKANIPDATAASGTTVKVSENLRFPFVPLTDLHMDNARGEISGRLAPERGDPATVQGMSIVGTIILLIAVINFINLTTARAGLRGREVALRKTVGATRRQLMAQFLLEAVLLSAIACILAVIIGKLALPYYVSLIDRDVTFTLLGQHGVIIPLILLVLGVGLLGGLYPAWHLSSFQPADVLRANQSSSHGVTLRLRQALVLLQFAASIALMIATTVVYQQTQYARSVNTGFDRANQLVMGGFNAISFETREAKTSALRDRILQIPGVTHVSRHRAAPQNDLQNFLRFQRPGETGEVVMEFATADGGFDDVFGLKLLAGRFLDHEIASDEYPPPASDRTDYNVVLTKKAVEAMGFVSPEAAVGETLISSVRKSDGSQLPARSTIVGVVDDIQFGSIRGGIEPVVFIHLVSRLSDMAVRFTGRIGPEVLSEIRDIWREIIPEAPYNATYLDSEITALYNEDERRGRIFTAFSALAVLVACIGLFGLSAFSIEQRTKEIGIRKVLGATSRQITLLLSWQFSKLALLANLIGWPIAWIIAERWLENFADRITLGATVFFFASAIAFIIAFATVAVIALRAASAPPVEALRSE